MERNTKGTVWREKEHSRKFHATTKGRVGREAAIVKESRSIEERPALHGTG